MLGLPGNPAAVYVAMQIYGKSLLDALQGNRRGPEWFTAILEHDLKEDARERFLRMYAYFDAGQLRVKGLAKQQSHMLSNLMQANCLVRIPASTKLASGTVLKGIFISN
ncbi:molybdopterin biosynthesis protein [Acinetobacter baumannii]|nr:molybdopterin biosynthesis protein [Acinetobacter baumannii]